MATRRRHDSNEDEATAIDMREASSKIHAALAKRKLEEVSPRAPTRKRSLPVDEPLHGSSEAPEEDTEFLSRPSELSSSEISSSDLSSEELSADEDSRTSAMQRPSAAAPRPQAPLPPPVPAPAPHAAALPRAPRPLPGREAATATAAHGAAAHGTGAHGQPASAGPTAPRITRIFMSPEAQAAQRRPTPEELRQHAQDFDDELTAPTDPTAREPETPPKAPPPRAPTVVTALPDSETTNPPEATPSRPRTKTARTPSASSSTTGGDAQTLEAEPADGTLIVDVPAGAVVFVNGVERGRGPSLKVRELDRYAKHAVRVHAEGFSPWKGTVSLDGRVAAKVRPNLKARGR
ncbi:MAG: PEGA domain-containing protein [Deltaproteobacteria bacterium]|nr:PEGA domain-containing protein [Deltaproteobacteria bacterium]